MTPRPLTQDWLDAATDLWDAGWHDGHDGIVPDALARLRTWDSFRTRLWDHRADTRIVVQNGALQGFYILDADQLYQFYIASQARGSGLAAQMMAHAETLLAENGHDTAWLACSVGNNRAARFYEKMGWYNTGVEAFDAYTEAGPVQMDVWRFEKALAR